MDHEIFLCQLVWDPNIKLFFESSLLQMVQNGLMIDVQLLGDVTTADMTVYLDISMILSTFTTAGLPERGASFT